MDEKFIRTVRVYNPKTKLHQNVTVCVKIDIDSVANVLGAAAIRNRSQVARHLKGRIVCSVRAIEVPYDQQFKDKLIASVIKVTANLPD